jgi:hypothetical protein
MTREDKDVHGCRIIDEYYADGEWYYKYKIYKNRL